MAGLGGGLGVRPGCGVVEQERGERLGHRGLRIAEAEQDLGVEEHRNRNPRLALRSACGVLTWANCCQKPPAVALINCWRFPHARGIPVRDQTARYGAFVGAPSRAEPERFFFLDDADRALIEREPKRREHNRLGFAVLMTSVRFLGVLPEDPVGDPLEVVEYLAVQLAIEDPSVLKAYRERENTRLEHMRELRGLREVLGYRDSAKVAEELRTWVDLGGRQGDVASASSRAGSVVVKMPRAARGNAAISWSASHL
ncbi:DUF4158 domain-containing protein [Actinomadura viridis]|uniref:DUF4158 domain-containing protein n=1 Tax=Actinomadura viridis TaxID=58110 RepID=UPI0027DC2946|nr:DUF4158 domain-containing protein [Actinomadura viridis]